MHHFSIIRLLNLIAAGLVVLLTGCTADPTSGTATVDQVCTIAAELMSVERSQVTAGSSIADLDGDEFDAIDMVMQLEDKYDVRFEREKLREMLEPQGENRAIKRLTMTEFADAVKQLQQQ